MRKRYFIVAFLLFICLPAQTQIHLGKVDDLTFYSQALNQNTTVRVYLPPGYNPDNKTRKYPVIITLHGATVSYEVYNFMLPIIDGLWLNQSIDPFILVMPNGLCPPFNGSFYTNSELYGNYEDLISKDVIQLIDSTYNTFGTRDFRAIMGHSMGAYGAFKQIFRHPDLYCAVAAHSGPVHIEMLEMLLPQVKEENGNPPYDWQYMPGRGLTNLIFTMAGAFSPDTTGSNLVHFPLDDQGEIIDSIMDIWNPHNIVEMVRWYMPATELGIYFDCGSRDDYQLYLHNRALSDSMTYYGIKHQYIEYFGDHTSGLPFRVPVAFKFLDQQFKGNHTSIDDHRDWNKNKVRVFPNPTTGRIYYEPESPHDLFSISIMNQSGKILESWLPHFQPLDISRLKPGVYELIFRYSDSLSSRKIIKTNK